MEQLETKITGELNTLKEKILQMKEGLETYSNLDALKKAGEDKKKVSYSPQPRWALLRAAGIHRPPPLSLS